MPAKKRIARTRRPAKGGSARRGSARKVSRKTSAAPRPKAPGASPERWTPATSAIGCLRQHMDYTSQAMDEVLRFYTEVLGFTRYQHDARFDYLTIQTGPSSSLGFMPPMPGPPEHWRPPREPVIYLLVGDVDAACKRLSAKGVSFLQEPTDMPWGHRAAILRDPEGRAVWLAQVKRG